MNPSDDTMTIVLSQYILIQKKKKNIQSYCHASSSSTSFAVSNIRQRFVLAFLHPAIPRLESFHTLNLFGALDVICDIVIGEILATFVTNTSAVSSGTPFGAIYLKDSITVAGGSLRTSDQLCVQSTFALHQADPIAD